MKKQVWDDLVTSIRQAGRIHRGEENASRTFVFRPEDERGSSDVDENPNPSSPDDRSHADDEIGVPRRAATGPRRSV